MNYYSKFLIPLDSDPSYSILNAQMALNSSLLKDSTPKSILLTHKNHVLPRDSNNAIIHEYSHKNVSAPHEGPPHSRLGFTKPQNSIPAARMKKADCFRKTEGNGFNFRKHRGPLQTISQNWSILNKQFQPCDSSIHCITLYSNGLGQSKDDKQPQRQTLNHLVLSQYLAHLKPKINNPASMHRRDEVDTPETNSFKPAIHQNPIHPQNMLNQIQIKNSGLTIKKQNPNNNFSAFKKHHKKVTKEAEADQSAQKPGPIEGQQTECKIQAGVSPTQATSMESVQRLKPPVSRNTPIKDQPLVQNHKNSPDSQLVERYNGEFEAQGIAYAIDSILFYYKYLQSLKFKDHRIAQFVMKLCMEREDLKSIFLTSSQISILTDEWRFDVRKDPSEIMHRFKQIAYTKNAKSFMRLVNEFFIFKNKLEKYVIEDKRRKIREVQSSINSKKAEWRATMQLNESFELGLTSIDRKNVVKSQGVCDSINRLQEKYGSFRRVDNYSLEVYKELVDATIRMKEAENKRFDLTRHLTKLKAVHDKLEVDKQKAGVTKSCRVGVNAGYNTQNRLSQLIQKNDD